VVCAIAADRQAFAFSAMTWTAFSLVLLAFAAFLFLAQQLLPQGFGIARFGGGQGTRRGPMFTPEAVEKGA
jgi:hypothetical protein